MAVTEERSGGSLGTFAGVFTPSVLTILGIILFLRLGYVVGAAGLGRALVIILIANTISILTSISLSAIATNLRVRGGGDYYLISRTLGIGFGGALGIVLFLAQSVSIAFHAIGFGEAVSVLGGLTAAWAPQAIAAAAVAMLFTLAWLGSDWATRFQYVVMGVLVAAIVAFFVGAFEAWDGQLLQQNFGPGVGPPFWVIFAIFFPAVTGFTQGVSMSGDLKNPGRSLPTGTFLAVGISIVVYLAVAFAFAATVPGHELVSDFGAMRRVSSVAWLVDAGVIAATLSSALASFLGAPRILQSLARDRVFPLLTPFALGHGANENPRRGVLFSLVIASATIAIGQLNLIAPIVSMFFLISYGLLNYATWYEARANSPSFRPRFRWFNQRLSLAGAIACAGVMLAIQPLAAVGAVAVLYGIHQYIRRRGGVERWADSERSHRMQRVRDDLHAIAHDSVQQRDWRPVILAFTDDPRRRRRLARFASWLEGNSGYTTMVKLLFDRAGPRAEEERQEVEKTIRKELRDANVPVFSRTILAADVDRELGVLLQSHGIGPLWANTVLLNWYDHNDDVPDRPGLASYGRYVRTALRNDCHVVLLAAGPNDFAAIEQTKPSKRRIDVWYRENATGNWMVLMSYLMTRSRHLEAARIRLFVPANPDEDPEDQIRRVREELGHARIDAEPIIVADPTVEMIIERSGDASVVLAPFALQDDRPISAIEGSMDDLAREVGVLAFVLACSELDLDTDPESGRPAEIAKAVDAQEQADKTSKKIEETLRVTEQELVELEASHVAALEDPALSDSLPAVVSQLKATRENVEKLRRRLAKAQVKATSASREKEELIGEDEDGEAPR